MLVFFPKEGVGGGGGRALRLQAPVISTIYIYILSISPPGYQRVTSQKKGILVTFCILI